jgi:hypothetical protein
MGDCSNNKLPIKYAYRFGQIAINMGFIDEGQVDEALANQIAFNSSTRLRPQKLIGEILFENGWITFDQIEKVLKEITQERKEYLNMELEHKRIWVKGLLIACTLEKALDDCPVKEFRNIPINTRLLIVDAINEEEIESIIEYHRKCLRKRVENL